MAHKINLSLLLNYLMGVSKILSMLLSSNPLVTLTSLGDLHMSTDSNIGMVQDSVILTGSTSSGGT